MRMPMFTAEAALSARRQSYALAQRPNRKSGVVTPQLIRCPRGSTYHQITDCFEVCSPNGTCKEKCVTRMTCDLD